MEARVKSDHRWGTVTAFGGIEFVKSEFRNVPAGLEKEAQAHPFLEIKAETAQDIDLNKDIVSSDGEPIDYVLGILAEPVVEIAQVEKPKQERTPEEKAAWAAKMAKARADKKAKGG